MRNEHAKFGDSCAWRPSDIASMIPTSGVEPGYNELIFDPVAWVQHLPRTILAFFYPAGGARQDAMGTRDRFIAEFSLSAADMPVLEYDAQHAASPFRRVS